MAWQLSLRRTRVLCRQAVGVCSEYLPNGFFGSNPPSHNRVFPGTLPEYGHARAFSSPAGTEHSRKPVVGFIGLGNMGFPMASNLLKAGYPLIACDKNASAVDAMTSMGASQVSNTEELPQAADVIITMLPSPTHVKDVYMGPSGLLKSGEAIRTALFVDSSTVDPQTAKLISGAAHQCRLSPGSPFKWTHHPRVLDCPVSGGVPGAQAATLSFMVGGDKDALDAAEPLLMSMGKRTVHCGLSGTGAAAKLCNNLALAVQMAGVAEALALGQRLGLDAALLTVIFNSSSARCWSSDTYNPVPGVMEGVPSANKYKAGFTCKLMLKDMNLVVDAAEKEGGLVTLGQEVQEMYKSAVDSGLEQLDFSVIFEHIYGGKPATS